MKNSIGFLLFVSGAAIGALTTCYSVKTYYKKKYEEQYQEDLASIKSRFTIEKTSAKNESSLGPEVLDEEDTTSSISDYAKKLAKEGYTKYSNADIPFEEKTEVTEIPFVIPPEEFRMLEGDGYSTVTLMYYADGVLADDNDEIVEDIDAWVGKESLDHFGEYDDDSVYVRNHRLKVDYEILRSQREYAEILEERPYLRRYDE